jgi:NAD(P)H-flavin reductase
VRPEHYPPVGEALLATLEHFCGAGWDADLAADWLQAYTVVAQTMRDAATDAATVAPPYWTAEVLHRERRGLDVAVLRLRVDQPTPYRYRAGQSCAVEVRARPRLWRYYSPANAPRRDGIIELHVKAVPGGQVSTAMLHSLHPGDPVKVGAPVGHRLTLDPHSARDLLLLAGGTGLAPLKAITEQIGIEDGRRRVMLIVGARTGADLYDLPALEAMAADLPWLTVVAALSHDPAAPGAERGTAVDVVLRLGVWDDHDIYVCGPSDMVATTRERLTGAGINPETVRCEDGTDDPYRPAPAAEQAVPDRDEVHAR